MILYGAGIRCAIFDKTCIRRINGYPSIFKHKCRDTYISYLHVWVFQQFPGLRNDEKPSDMFVTELLFEHIYAHFIRDLSGSQ